MGLKHLRVLLFILLAFCFGNTSAQKVKGNTHAAHAGQLFKAAEQQNSNGTITGLFNLQQVFENQQQPRPVKIGFGSAANFGLFCSTVKSLTCICFGFSKYKGHYARFCKLILFPFHGFW